MGKNRTKLFYDLETSSLVVAGYGSKWDFRVHKILKHSELMCFSYVWDDDKNPTFVNRWDYPSYKEFLTALRDIIDEAKLVIAYNGIGFDNKMINTLFIQHGIPLPSPYLVTDPLRVARSKLKLPSNSLGDLCEFLGLGGKEAIGNAQLEDDWMTGTPSPKTVKLMKKYNNTDVTRLREVYEILLPLTNNHPNMGEIMGEKMVCPKCGKADMVVHKTRIKANGNTIIQYQCNSCGGYHTDSSVKKTGILKNA